MSALDSEGKTYKSFVITKYFPLEELQSTLIEAIHEPTGARIIHIANDDPDNLFCLSFQTLPYSSNGVAHILEHTVLCGSKKFPIKDPFFSMTRRSLNTYMNALTGQDFTCYPASSQIEKDFYNLLDVYLDAVFHPELKRQSFLQEGHRLEFAEPQNPQSPLQFQGVVYNEMKGAMSSIETRLWEAVMKHLTPELPYGLNSGGDPKEIPNLTYEELKEFHQTFYHPSRCLFFFYGNIPLAKHLDFIQNNALHGAEKLSPLPPLSPQKRFSSPVTASARFPLAEGESPEQKTQIAFSWLTAQITDQEEVLALCLLDSLLMDTDASTLKKELLKSGLCKAADSSIDTEMSEVPISIVCKGCDGASAKKIKDLIFKTLQEASFSPEQIEASLHQLEFQRTEIDTEGGIPFGLTLFFKAALVKHHGSEAERALLIHTQFKDLRDRLKNPDFLPYLIRKYLVDNPHFVQVTLLPDPNLEKEEKKEEEERLARIRPTVDGKALVAQSDALISYQEEVEKQSLDCLPKLSLRDIPPKSRDFPLVEQEGKRLSIHHHNCFTNNIFYADLIYDLPDIPVADLPLLSLFTRFATELGCAGRDYADTLAYQQSYTGGVGAALALHVSHSDPNTCRPSFSLKGKAMARHADKLLSLFVDLIQGTDCKDRSRLQELLSQHVTSLQNRVVKNALNYATQISLSPFSSASFVQDQWGGLSYYQAILKLAKNPKNLSESLIRMQEMVLGRGKPHLVLACDNTQFLDLQKQAFFGLEEKLPSRPLHPWVGHYSLPSIQPQVRFIAAPVAFTSLGLRTSSYKDPNSPYLLLSTELLDNCHLHKEIREKGGAYGSGASYAPSTGNFYLYSYRDPHLARTALTFHKAIEKIGDCHFSEEELEEAKFGVLQTIDAPVSPGSRAMTAFSWKRAGRSLEERQKFRQKILEATREDVAHAVHHSILSQKSLLVSFLGEELYEKEKKKLKTSLASLPIEI